jgi:hypothetical protein
MIIDLKIRGKAIEQSAIVLTEEEKSEKVNFKSPGVQ